MNKTRCFLKIEVKFECPHCKEYIDLLQSPFTDDGWIYDLVMPNDRPWSGACQDFSKEYENTFGEKFECPECGKHVDIGKIEYI